MMRTKPTARILILSAVLLGAAVLTSGCMSSDRIVIDGETALLLEQIINDQLWDNESALHGNTDSNMRNGGYVLSDGTDVWFTVSMRFEDGSAEHYLQHLLKSQVGSLNARDEIVAPLQGTLVGMVGTRLVYVDTGNGDTLSVLDLETYEQQPLFDQPVAHAHLYDRTVYLSTQGKGDLYLVEIPETGATREPALLYTSGGRLVGVSGGMAYLLGSTEGSSVIRRYDLQRKMVAQRIVGGPYEDIQVSGSWIYYKDGQKLMRQMISGGTPVVAIHQDVDEYAVWGHWLAITDPDGGIYVSHLDGTGIVRLVEDAGSGLQLADNMLFYRNKHDGGAVYAIDLVEGTRTALLGFTMTDGGIKFDALDRTAGNAFDEFVLAVADKRSLNDQYWGSPLKAMLFAEIGSDGSISYYRHVDDTFAPEEADAIVVVSTDATVLGQYTDGGIAYRLDRKLTLYTPGNDHPVLTFVTEGRPPSEIKIGSGDRRGLPLSWHQKALELRNLVVR